jgi:heme/copper-type cytochrome/quinol oxidase subunit 2
MNPELGEITTLKRRLLALCGITAVLLLVLAGSALAQSTPGSDAQNGRLGLPDGASTYSIEIDDLYVWIFWITTVMFILTEGLLVVFCVIYRRRPGHRPTYTHGNTTAEITWTVVPALMLLAIAIVQIGTWNKIKKEFPPPGPGVTEVDTFAETFNWNFRYPGTKAKVQGDNDVTNLGAFHIPFGDKTLLNIRSRDVIHSLFIPHMRVKQDLVPGLRQKIWFEANRIQLIDLRTPPTPNGESIEEYPNPRIARQKQAAAWVNEAKAFEKGGPYKDKTIAVAGYNINKDTGLYQPVNPKSKIRVLKDGSVVEGASWDQCDCCIGIFDIACAELCGLGHYKMKAFLTVEPRIAFEAWLKDQADNDYPPIWKFWKQ